MLHRLLFTLALLTLITIFSCKKNNDIQTGCANNTGWLKDGHESVFVNKYLPLSADTLYATYTEISPGIFESASKMDDGTQHQTQNSFLQVCNNSIYNAASADLTNKQEIYRLDGKVGDSWTYTSSTGGNTITTTTTIIEKNVSVTVPAGTFICMNIQRISSFSTGVTDTLNTYMNNSAGHVLVVGTKGHYELARKNF